MVRVLEAAIDYPECTAQEQLKTLRDTISTYQSRDDKEYSTTQVHAYCLQFLAVMDVYDEAIGLPGEIGKMNDKLMFLNKSDFSQVFRDREVFIDELKDVGLPFVSLGYFHHPCAKQFLFWPSFKTLQ